VLDKHGGQSDLSKESVIASSETLVRKFLEATEGFEWRG
jgi:hypothetical protein